MISRDNQLASMGWTKEETDYLLDMLEQFDLRFLVVADRYNVSAVTCARSGFGTHQMCGCGRQVYCELRTVAAHAQPPNGACQATGW